MKKNTFSVSGMKCAACKKLIEDIASDYPAIKSFIINYESKSVEAEYEESFDWKMFQQEISKFGNYSISA